jgi:hypothetical protein
MGSTPIVGLLPKQKALKLEYSLLNLFQFSTILAKYLPLFRICTLFSDRLPTPVHGQPGPQNPLIKPQRFTLLGWGKL